ncbi:DUF1016 N-terminal domain-containing protein [Paraburkholderia sp. BR10954]|uniref:DUF1016 N-terminal domain-containing protein n=1 Tax=Paraburkholderia sp. BR10954 TaxID=3236995 RepID=UPI0034D152EE
MCKSPLPKIPWAHVVTLLDKLDDGAQRLWYAEKSLEHGWPRSVLMMQIETVHTRVLAAPSRISPTGCRPQQPDLARDAPQGSLYL